jgi:hypothetical protein
VSSLSPQQEQLKKAYPLLSSHYSWCTAPALLTTLEQTALLMDIHDKKIIPFFYPLWEENGVPSRLYHWIEVLKKTKAVNKKEEMKTHKRWYSWIKKDANTLVVYTDRFQIDNNRKQQVGAELVLLHKEVVVGKRRQPLGGKAEVYNSELIGLIEEALLAVP